MRDIENEVIEKKDEKEQDDKNNFNLGEEDKPEKLNDFYIPSVYDSY